MITMFWKFEYWHQITEENVILTTMTPLQIKKIYLMTKQWRRRSGGLKWNLNWKVQIVNAEQHSLFCIFRQRQTWLTKGRGEVHKKKILFQEARPFNLPHICLHFELKNTKITFCPFLKLTKTFLYSWNMKPFSNSHRCCSTRRGTFRASFVTPCPSQLYVSASIWKRCPWPQDKLAWAVICQ